MHELFTTVIVRPYVFLFLAAFLFLAIRRWGWRRTVLWLISGYAIAWLSEYSSIHNGFPYGHYKYVYESMSGELMIAGVPFFDSLSYPFLAFAGYMTGLYLVGVKRPDPGFKTESPRITVLLILLGAFLTMMLDVIVDPVATMGARWFLGEIHYYVNPGWYFGVPLTNFGGWFLVAFCIIAFNVLAWHAFPKLLRLTRHARALLGTPLEPLFYISIALFQTVMAFWIGETVLGLVNAGIISVLTAVLFFRRKKGESV